MPKSLSNIVGSALSGFSQGGEEAARIGVKEGRMLGPPGKLIGAVAGFGLGGVLGAARGIGAALTGNDIEKIIADRKKG